MFYKDVRLQNLMKLRFSLQESIQKLLFLKFYLNLLKLFLIEHYLSLFLIKRIWSRFNEPWLCRSHIYIITIVKLENLYEFSQIVLSGWYSVWHFLSWLKMKNHLGWVSPSHFPDNVLIETSNICFKKF